MDYELIRSKRRTLSIEISSNGQLLVRAPKRMSQQEIDDFIHKKEDWIKKHQEKFAKKQAEQGNELTITQKELDELKKAARKYFPDRVDFYAKKMNLTYGKIAIRCQQTVWGSCSSKGNLNFNCLLMMMDEEIRDYIIVHELSHRKHMNHSAAFWKCVESVMPDYRQRRTKLKNDGRPLLNAVIRSDSDDRKYYTYILRCIDNSLYTGYTTDLEKRIAAHNSGKGAKYTKFRRPVTLAYFETFDTKQEAQRREALIKQMTKREKEKLISLKYEN